MFYDYLTGLLRAVVAGTSAYLALLILWRVSGERTPAKPNAVDFVVTIALGSTLATVLLSKDIALVERVTAMALLITLQLGVAWSVSRSDRFEAMVKDQPTLVYRPGFLVGDGQAIVLESDGTIGVLADVRGSMAT